MPTTIATHSGPFHADDVTAVALWRRFADPSAAVIRTRDPARIAAADLAFDVGAELDPARGRFDHHQASYTGPRSSAGLVLDHLEAIGRVEPGLAASLRAGLVDYLDDVDTGRVAPRPDVPCLPRIVEAFGQLARTDAELDAAFEEAARVAERLVSGLTASHARARAAVEAVREAMAAAARDGRRVLYLDEYLSWKAPYFELGGASHPTDFVLFPSGDGSWRIVAIPPEPSSFAQKRPLPEAWAGLVDADLERVTGVPGARFCHKNRFIAVFATREGAIRALTESGLHDAEAGRPA